jgi:hypothetical protein
MIYPDTFNNERRYIFSNWSSEDFMGQWGGTEYLIEKGKTKEFPMYLAYHLTKHFVDREMSKSGKSSLLGVDEARKEYEDKTMAEIVAGVDSPALATLKEEIRKEVVEIETKKKGKKVVKEVKEEVAEFEGANK